jgi:hypothetical protein
VVRIFQGLRKDKMGNVPQGGTCMGREVGPGKQKNNSFIVFRYTYSIPAHGKLTTVLSAV